MDYFTVYGSITTTPPHTHNKIEKPGVGWGKKIDKKDGFERGGRVGEGVEDY
jgi:hypothetical protein